MAWLYFLAIFVIGAFVTFGVGYRLEADRRAKSQALRAGGGSAATGNVALSTSLTEELKAIVDSGESSEEWLRRTRVPYGHCTSPEACGTTTRCVQCESFETTDQDLPALRDLYAQERDLERQARLRGLDREVEIHGSVATSIERHLLQFEGLSKSV